MLECSINSAFANEQNDTSINCSLMPIMEMNMRNFQSSLSFFKLFNDILIIPFYVAYTEKSEILFYSGSEDKLFQLHRYVPQEIVLKDRGLLYIYSLSEHFIMSQNTKLFIFLRKTYTEALI